MFNEGCFVCGEELVYSLGEENKTCVYCGNTVMSNVSCPKGHFICDDCHSAPAIELIEKFCNQTELADPLQIAEMLMKSPMIKMHGPEHHYLVPAALIAAYYNKLSDAHQKKHKLAIARLRSETVPGGYCGTHGTCGAAIGGGIFLSIVLGSNPLAGKEWKFSNQLTGISLLNIAEQGGPRCCKRDSFIAIQTAADFILEKLNVALDRSEIICEFSTRNKQCKFSDCTYYSY
ncbi:MAG: hypothetical protein K9H49_02555 [Bacteroidales bacterium]|nr:hypothetical protein [Bacteroidales bacterium]MCF8403451.1 hypothetical protein [Bacteroidales bacterium]